MASEPSSSRSSEPGTPSSAASRRRRRFGEALAGESVDKRALAELTWSGCPEGIGRREVWQLLLDYRPLARDRRTRTLQRKRGEYAELRISVYEASPAVQATAPIQKGQRLDADGKLLQQLRKDLPRLASVAEHSGLPGLVSVVESTEMQLLMERVLFIWAMRQPVSGYVQGHDGILLLLMLSFLGDAAGVAPQDLQLETVRERGLLEGEAADEVEADCYWCISKLLSEMYDHYTEGFPGVRRMSMQLEDLLRRVDAPLAGHLSHHNLNTFDAVFRWMICLMVRELPVAACLRLWDSLIAESAQAGGGEAGRSAGFDTLLLYFCACFMAKFSARIRAMEFEEMIMFFNQPTTLSEMLNEADVEVLMAEAYVLKSLFQQSQAHLSAK